MPSFLPTALLAALTVAAPLCAQTEATGLLFDRMARHVEASEADLIELRNDLHRHPELSGEEERTAGVVAQRLADLGFEVRTGVGGHGVVGILQGGHPGPMVAFRADMDAVRSTAPDPSAVQSLTPGVRHICGHDVHTAIGVGIAEGFAAVRDDLTGSVMLVFQPAEESGTGANAMLADGAFEPVAPDAIFALHTAPFPVGQVATVAGGMMAGRARVSVTIEGTGDRQAAAREVRAALQAIGTVPPAQAGQLAPPGFVLVQLFGGGGSVVRGQIMTAGPDDRARAKTAALAALDALDLPGITLATDYDEQFMDGVTNDADLVALATTGIRDHASDIGIQSVPGAVPSFSEDFGSFQAVVPGVMLFLGVNNPEAGTVGMPHDPDYVADDAAIAVGTRAMLAAMTARLEAGVEP